MKHYTLEKLRNTKKGKEIEDRLDRDQKDLIEAILEYNVSWIYDPKLKEYKYTIDDLLEAEEKIDEYTRFRDIDDYHDFCDETLEFTNRDDIRERYFDYEAYHRDCDFDIYEAENGICLMH